MAPSVGVLFPLEVKRVRYSDCSPTYEEDTRVEELSKRLTCDHPLVQRALGYIVDVFVFDDHFETASRIKVIHEHEMIQLRVGIPGLEIHFFLW